MKNALISILIPFKNTSKFIGECIESILNQNYQNWELIMVDDHSSDGSYQIVSSYAQNDERIELLKNKGSGIIPALQTAYSKSRGQFITRMDSDDRMHSRKLELMFKDLQQYGKGHVALGQVSYFNENGLGKGYLAYEKWLNKLTKNGTNYSEIYKECVIPSPCWMLNRDDFDTCGAFQSLTYPEDYDLAFRLYKNHIKCIPSEHVLHFWRDHGNRASRTDENYSDNSFIELKVSCFLKLDYHKRRPTVIWGAGQKGKKIARLLKQQGIDFKWVCNNPKKIGKHIYNIELKSFQAIKSFEQPQIIIAVANPKDQQEILCFLDELKMKRMQDYFFFC